MTGQLRYRVRLDGGDGYCPFFSSPQILERVHEDWFPASLGNWGAAILFRIVEGGSKGDYIGLTCSPDYDDIDEWIVSRGYCGGVAHHIRRPGPGFQLSDADPCGKTYVELVK